MSARTLGLPTQHRLIPPAVTGYGLNGEWSVVVPADVDITNLVANPSIETNTTGYTAVGGSVARSTEKQYAGAYSLKVTPTAGTGDGVFYGTVSVAAATRYPWSFAFFGVGGIPYKAYWATTGGVQVGTVVKFRGTGRWQRIQVPWEETSTTTRRLYIVKDGSARVNPFYVDAMLVPSPAEGMDVWRYFDGDTVGFVPNLVQFYWTGTAHGSTSVMRANTRAGGRIKKLAEFGFTLVAMLGLGLPTPNNISIPLALPGGESYQRTLSPAHEFTLAGTLAGTSLLDLSRKHAALTAALDVRRQPITQPLILRYEPQDDCGNVAGNPLEIACSFTGGLEGTRDNLYSENLGLNFRVHLPQVGVAAFTEGAALDVRDDLTDADFVVRRNANGIWSDMQTGLDAGVASAVFLPDGRILVGGSFSNAGGNANADNLAVYDPTADTFSSLNTTPLNGKVQTLLLLPTGNVLVGGDFTNAGGNADADFLCLLTISTGAFSALNATPLSNSVKALALLPNNTVAVGGDFLNAGGAGTADFLAKLTLSTGAYSAFDTVTALSDTVNALAVDKFGTLWIGGEFTNVAGVASQDYLTALRGAAYSTFQVVIPANSPLDDFVIMIEPLSDGNLVIGGRFENVNGDANWDYLFIGVPIPVGGSGEIGLFRTKLFEINAAVHDAAEVSPGLVILVGEFTQANGVAVDRILQYTNNTLQPIDMDLPGTNQISSISGLSNGNAIVGFNDSGTGYTSGTTAITNSGSADAFPVIIISYSASATVVAPLYSIRNLTTGQVISFNLNLLPGEVVTLDLREGVKTFTSSIRGNIFGSVLPGSNWATFKLSPGDNTLNIFIGIDAAANASAYAWWTPAYDNLADAWN